MGQNWKSTKQAAAEIPCEVYSLNYQIRLGRVRPSFKCATGRWWWSDEAIEAARAVLANDRRHRLVEA